MKKNQLPKQVLNTLLAYQIKSDDILDVCPFDLSFDSEYISGYLFLTSTKIGVAKSRHEQMTVRYFRGPKTADMQKWKRLRIFRSRKHSIVQSVERCTRIQKEKSVRSA